MTTNVEESKQPEQLWLQIHKKSRNPSRQQISVPEMKEWKYSSQMHNLFSRKSFDQYCLFGPVKSDKLQLKEKCAIGYQ